MKFRPTIELLHHGALHLSQLDPELVRIIFEVEQQFDFCAVRQRPDGAGTDSHQSYKKTLI